jgi:hypothetical protein
VVVSLLERDEEAQLNLEGEAAAAVTGGMEFRSFPVPDRGVPVSYEAAATLVNDIVEALNRGNTVVVHCRQGIGRSALITGAVLVAEGEDVQAALRTIKESRGLEVPETDQQQQWLHDFAARLGTQGPPGAIVTRGGLVFIGGADDDAFYAFDADTGKELWGVDLPRRTSGTPMTYRARSGRQFVLITTGGGTDAALLAFALPQKP